MTEAQKLKGGPLRAETQSSQEGLNWGCLCKGRQNEADSVTVGKIADWVQLLFQK